MSDKIYIIGAGIAGLTAAYYASIKNKVEIFEASPLAGGRCRSYFDEKLRMEVNNGNHLVLKANRNFIKVCREIGSYNNFSEYRILPKFYDAENEIFLNNKEVRRYFLKYILSSFLKSKTAQHNKFIKLINESIFNTNADEIDKNLIKTVGRKILFNSLAGIRYLQPKENWQKSFINPLLQKIKESGGEINFLHPLTKIDFDKNTATKLTFSNEKTIDCRNSKVIIAISNHSANKLLGEENCPAMPHNAILNIHFKLAKNFPERVIGVISNEIDWIFCRDNLISITKSVFDSSNYNARIITEKAFSLCSKIFGTDFQVQESRLLIEKSATFSCTKEAAAKRPHNKTCYTNIFLCGDYTNTKLPATIEGAIVSGKVVNKLINKS